MKFKGSAALVTVALGACLLCGCGGSGKDTTASKETTEAASKDTKENTKESKKDTTEETGKKDTQENAATEAADTTAADTESQDTEAQQTETEEPLVSDDKIYAGIWEQSAMNSALEYAGSSYMVVSTEKAYLRNVEKWLVGIQKIDGSDDTVYYLYVDDKEVVPQSELPSGEGADISEDKIYAGLWEQSAMNNAIEYMGSDYMVVSTEKAYLRNVEKWLIGLKKADGSDDTVVYVYVDDSEVVPQA